MKAIIHTRFGPPEVLELGDLEKPVPARDELLVRVHAASVNRAEWYAVTGTPWVARPQMGLFKPREKRFGVDFAGVVEAVGDDVTQFRPGDEVFGGRTGAFAEHVCVREERAVVPKPANVSFEQAAAVPVAALTALQGLRDKGGIRAGHRVLINGASGGVGALAIQVAKSFDAEVTAVCSPRNVEQARSLGADEVVDYTQEDFTRRGRRYDLLLDVAGSRSWSECTRVLEPNATLVMVGAPRATRLLGPLGHVIGVRLASMRSSQKVAFFIAQFNKPDLEILRSLLESGQLTPVVERTYGLHETAEALRYMGEGHVRSKLVISL
jgi:NADPH:quinone reductase-like Zn-dependent oxidoreductase